MGIKKQAGYVPVQASMICEICQEEKPLRELHSLYGGYVAYAMSGGLRDAYGCKNEQHYGCSPECALLAHLACLFTHVIPPGAELQSSDLIKIREIVMQHANEEEMKEHAEKTGEATTA